MYIFLLIVHLLICLALIGVVLIQSGKGGGLAGGAFGGSAQTVFGGRGATDVVTRATMVLGGLFFLTSVTLALMTSGGGRTSSRSLVQEAARKSATTAPAPGATPPAGGSAVPGGSTAPPAGTAPAPSTAPTPPPTTPPAGGR